MERKIGEIFEYNGEWYQCVEGNCAYCSIEDEACEQRILNDVCKLNRIFKKLEKVGEPYISSRNKKRYQLYRCFCLPIITKDRRIEIGDANWVGIEIKQNKEDMKEKNNAKHSNSEKIGKNLRPFDLQKAREGKPVCTRDGRKARIICFDAKGDQPIIALVTMDNRKEFIETYHLNGSFNDDDKTESWGDLMMLHEKKEGWVNVYKEENNDDEHFTGMVIYKTRKDAFDNACPRGYKATVKINWEE